ncbi:His-Xaa-Ser system protein HxsD [Floccifex porci]|uniref:His-Xaa-Ser system protein HxsD n=1 Tax=Floccifex porci TaxID=2606629 RepID=A0A7X2T4B0_9FIRM|nr:His-Xaa-Ser system protein HxsD [Floccifex porci]MSS01626.1 His-Xaa-Ser system protein HxsD [Floccifex porci]
MKEIRFRKELYSKVALIKAAYNFSDKAYIHLDADESYYYVRLETKLDGKEISENEFINEMLSQSIRHEVYLQTKDIRELLLARAMSTSLVAKENVLNESVVPEAFSEDEILKDWFNNENN